MTPRKERRTTTHTSPSKSRLAQQYEPQGNGEAVPSTPKTKGKMPVRGVGGRFFTPTVAITTTATAATAAATPKKSTTGDDVFTIPVANPTKPNLFKRPQTPPPLPPGRSNVPVTPKSANRVYGSPGRGIRDDIIVEVFALLVKNGVHLKGSAGDLRELLERHVWQKEGIVRGRQAAREALLRKTEECEKLQARVRELEEEKAIEDARKELMRRDMSQANDELEQLRLKSPISTRSTETQL